MKLQFLNLNITVLFAHTSIFVCLFIWCDLFLFLGHSKKIRVV